MSTKSFDLGDQGRFAALSGDYNPLHLDPIYSRRLMFGEPVVHGVHLVLCALEELLENYSSPRIIKRLKAVFSRHLPLGKPFQIKILAADDEKLEIQSAGEECHLFGQFHSDENSEYWSVPLPDKSQPSECRELSFAQAVQTEGVAPLYVNLAKLQIMFPRLATMIPTVQTAEILATTRLTGMDCPGLHTIFHSLDLHFEPNAESLEMGYRVIRSDERFSTIQLGVEGYGVHGELSTFFRPAPVQQLSFTKVAEKVRTGEFRHVRALIVGGSRGLGELTAKIIAAGGGDAAITYHRGKSDAECVVNEICAAQGKCHGFHLDVTQPFSQNWMELPQDWPPTHLFYFATPHIGSACPDNSYSDERFALFREVYITSFGRLMESILQLNFDEIKIFYPSTAIIDAPEKGQEEYIAAKTAGEMLCRDYAGRFPKLKFHVPRLPRMKTDQTAGIMPRRTADVLAVMLNEIRRMEAK